MKCSILITTLFCCAISIATAYDHVIEDGDNFYDLSLEDYETLLMTGGEGHHLFLHGWSEATIEGTAPLIDESAGGGIWMLGVGGYCNLDFSGGEVHQFDIDSYATATLSGGSFDEIWSYQDYGNPHIEMICRDHNYNETTRYLSGTWEDFSTFNIYLSSVPEVNHGYDPAIENFSFTIIPEPATLLLFGLGSLILKKKH
jgi:hypothetical protein